MNAGYILKVEPTRFANGQDMRCEEKRKVKKYSKVLSLNNF